MHIDLPMNGMRRNDDHYEKQLSVTKKVATIWACTAHAKQL